jgi:hypothetical protein
MYQQMMDTFRNKMREYDAAQCKRAMDDVYETLSLHKDPTPYQQKLLCELDAIRDRQRQLKAKP